MIIFISMVAGCRSHVAPTSASATSTITITPGSPTLIFTNTRTFTPTRTATNPATPTRTPTIPSGSGVVISVVAQRGDNHGLQVEQFGVVATDSTGSTLNTAAVSMRGPTGQIGIPTTNGIMMYQSNTLVDYPYNAQFAVSVTYNAVNYYGTFTTMGPMTIASDASSITWAGSPFMSNIGVTDPNSVTKNYMGTDTSPFDVNSTGIFAAGPGTYSVVCMNIFMQTGFMTGGTGIQSTLTMSDTLWVDRTR